MKGGAEMITFVVLCYNLWKLNAFLWKRKQARASPYARIGDFRVGFTGVKGKLFTHLSTGIETCFCCTEIQQDDIPELCVTGCTIIQLPHWHTIQHIQV